MRYYVTTAQLRLVLAYALAAALSSALPKAWAAIPQLPNPVTPLTLTWVFTVTALISGGGAVYQWHKHPNPDPNGKYNDFARYLNGNKDARERVLREFLNADLPSSGPGEVTEVPTAYKAVVNEDKIKKSSVFAFMTAAARWQDAWDKLTRTNRALKDAGEVWKKYRSTIRTSIIDITRPPENASDDVILAAAEEYVGSLVDLTMGTGFTKSGQSSSKRLQQIIDDFKKDMVQGQWASGVHFSLSEVVPHLSEMLERVHERLHESEEATLHQLPERLKLYATQIQEGLGIQKVTTEQQTLAWALTRAKATGKELKEISSAMGKAPRPDPATELKQQIAVLLQLAGSTDVASPPTTLQDAIDRLKVLFHDMNGRLPQGLTQKGEPNATTIAKEFTNVAQTFNIIVQELPVKTSANYKVVNKLLEIRLNLVKRLEERYSTDITERRHVDEIMTKLPQPTSSTGPVQPSHTTNVQYVEKIVEVPAKVNWELLAHNAGFTGTVTNERDFLREARRTQERVTQATMTRGDWRAIAKASGLPRATYDNVDDQGSLERGVAGELRRLYATIDASRARPLGGAGDGEEVDTEALAAILASLSAGGGGWNCETKCKPPQYNGNCDTILVWEKLVRAELSPIWHKDTEGFRTKAAELFRQAMCGIASGWAESINLDTVTSGATNFGTAFQKLIDHLKEMNGINEDELEREALRVFECKDIKADCWSEFWMTFSHRAKKAGKGDNLLATNDDYLRNRLIDLLPPRYRGRLDMMAQNRSTDLTVKRDVYDLRFDEIRTHLASHWKKEQLDPGLKPCDNLSCKSGLPKEHCPCKPTRVTGFTGAGDDPRCLRHEKPTEAQTKVILANLRGLTKKNDDDGKSPHFKTCLRMSVCARCMGKFNREQFDKWWESRK